MKPSWINEKNATLAVLGVLLAVVGYFLIGDVLGALLGGLAALFGLGEKLAQTPSDDRQAHHEARAEKSSKAAQAAHSEAVRAGKKEIERSSGKTLENRFRNMGKP